MSTTKRIKIELNDLVTKYSTNLGPYGFYLVLLPIGIVGRVVAEENKGNILDIIYEDGIGYSSKYTKSRLIHADMRFELLQICIHKGITTYKMFQDMIEESEIIYKQLMDEVFEDLDKNITKNYKEYNEDILAYHLTRFINTERDYFRFIKPYVPSTTNARCGLV